MSKTEEIRVALQKGLAPTELTVEDDSARHRGHAGYQEGGESHFNVRVRSDSFAGKSRVARHRMVHAALGPKLIASIHALSLDLDVSG